MCIVLTPAIILCRLGGLLYLVNNRYCSEVRPTDVNSHKLPRYYSEVRPTDANSHKLSGNKFIHISQKLG